MSLFGNVSYGGICMLHNIPNCGCSSQQQQGYLNQLYFNQANKMQNISVPIQEYFGEKNVSKKPNKLLLLLR